MALPAMAGYASAMPLAALLRTSPSSPITRLCGALPNPTPAHGWPLDRDRQRTLSTQEASGVPGWTEIRGLSPLPLKVGRLDRRLPRP